MYPGVDEKVFNGILEGLYSLTEEYKLLLNSKEYRNGRSLHLYLELIRKREMKNLFKRICNRRTVYNAVLSDTKVEKPPIERFVTRHRIAVYTSVFGSYDKLMNPIYKPDNIDYFIISDQKIPEDSIWKPINFREVIPQDIVTNVEKNRYVKILPHKIFMDYDYSIYVDGNVFITSDLSALIYSLDNYPVAMHKHKNRDCVYEEIAVCISKGKDSIDALEQHRKLLKDHGVPEHLGLLEATVIARKHNDKRCIELMQMWWDEFEAYSKRDQISLIDAMWCTNTVIDKVATLGDNIMKNDLFVIIPHL